MSGRQMKHYESEGTMPKTSQTSAAIATDIFGATMQQGTVITILRCLDGHFLPWPVDLKPLPTACTAVTGTEKNYSRERCDRPLEANLSRFQKVRFDA